MIGGEQLSIAPRVIVAGFTLHQMRGAVENCLPWQCIAGNNQHNSGLEPRAKPGIHLQFDKPLTIGV